MVALNSKRHRSGRRRLPPSGVYQTEARNTADQTTYTFSSVVIGTAAADRYVLVGVAGFDANDVVINSVTVGGITASVVVSDANRDAGIPAACRAALYIANVPTGSTADIVVTFSEGQVRASIGVWALYDLQNGGAASDTASQAATGDTTLVGSLDCPKDGIVAAFVAQNGSGGSRTTTWTGVSENFDANIETNASHSGGFTQYATEQAGLTVQSAASGAVNNCAMVAASFR